MSSTFKANGQDCSFFVAKSGVDTDKVTEICTDMDFYNPSSLQFFLNATWYGGPYLEAMYAYTGFTTAQWAAFTSMADFTDFQFQTVIATAGVAGQYGCANSNNCTGAELAQLQWGSSSVTTNPASTWDATYFPVQDTVMNWGDASWLPYGSMTLAPEYKYIVTDSSQAEIDTAFASIITSTSFNAYGLMSKYSWINVITAYLTGDTTTYNEYTSYYAITDATFDLTTMISSLRADMEKRFFGPMFQDYTISDLLNGFESSDANNLSEIASNSYYDGDLMYLRNLTTPIYHNMYGIMNVTSFGMYTGSNGLTEIGNLRIINENSDVNKREMAYNGTGVTNITLSRPLTGSKTYKDISLDKVSYGMQFPPSMSQDDVKVFNARAIDIDHFQYDTEEKLGDKDLSLYKFQGKNWAGDLSFASSLDLYEEQEGCNACDILTAGTTITVNGEAWTQSTEPSDFYIKVQPETGYLYESKKSSSIFMRLGGEDALTATSSDAVTMNPTPFPTLDVLYNVTFPLYDLEESLTANQGIFTSQFDYVADSKHTVRGLVIAFSVLTALFLILGIVALVIDKLRGGNDNKAVVQRDELLERHMESPSQ